MFVSHKIALIVQILLDTTNHSPTLPQLQSREVTLHTINKCNWFCDTHNFSLFLNEQNTHCIITQQHISHITFYFTRSARNSCKRIKQDGHNKSEWERTTSTGTGTGWHAQMAEERRIHHAEQQMMTGATHFQRCDKQSIMC